ncbi:MAG: hypothetical protein KDA45_11275, partial [Planctomycetales bacterium]|nr:hypothetical protein [Planctomycetales bacterium]
TTPGGVYPSPDPADTPPSLPNFPTSSSSSSQSSSQSNLRPQLRSIVRHPRAGEQPSGSRPGTGLREQSQEESRQPPPTMQPIPTPEDFEPQPRWNPGLLREEDMTAGRAATPSQADYAAQADYAGQSKQIHWASFESTRNVAKQPTGDGLRPIATAAPPAARAGAGAASPVLPPRRTGGWQASR